MVECVNACKVISDTTFICFYYVGALIITVLRLHFGFSGSHTVPIAILLSVFLLLVGVGWTVIDLILFIARNADIGQALIIQLCGLLVNGLAVYCLFVYGSQAT